MQAQAHQGQEQAGAHLDTVLIGSSPIAAVLCGDPGIEADFAAGERQEGWSLGRSQQLHPEQGLVHLRKASSQRGLRSKAGNSRTRSSRTTAAITTVDAATATTATVSWTVFRV